MKTKIILLAGLLFLLAIGVRICSDDEHSQENNSDGLVVLAADLEAKKITEEQAFVYKVQSVFNSPHTPKKYRTFTNNDYGTRLMSMIKFNWESFSPEAKKQLEPYYVSPLDPKSFINNPTYEKNTDFLVSEVYADTQPQSIATRNHFVTQNGKIKIWYLPHEKKYAQLMLEAFNTDRIYEREVGLMGFAPLPETTISDDKLDIFFYRNVSWWGLCSATGQVNPARKYSAWIGINLDMHRYYGAKYKAYMKSTLAHELFHSIQYAIDIEDEASWWWQEATATWAEHYIYPKVNFEHRFKNGLFEDFWMTRRLTLYGSNILLFHEYYAYIFPLFLAQKDGPYIIRNLWKESEPVTKHVLDVIEDQTHRPFKELFTEFAVWMFNEKPEKHFLDGTVPLTNVKPSKEIINVKIGKNKKRRFEIQRVGILFEEYLFNDSTVKSVDFDMNSLAVGYPDVGVWAFIKVKGQEMISEDWSNTTFRNFCFDIPEENLERVVIAYANSSRSKDVPANQILADVTAYKDGCAAKLSLTWNMSSASSAPGTPNKYGFFMGGSGKRQESGQADVVFREVEKDPGFPEMGKILVPFGGFSFAGSVDSQSQGGVQGMFQINGTGKLSGSGGDRWNGKNLSNKEYGYIELKVYNSKASAVRTQEQSDMGAAKQMAGQMGLGGLFGQALSMQQGLEADGTARRDLNDGEIAYDLSLEIHDIPASMVSTAGSENSTMDMQTPIEIYKIVPKDKTSYPISSSGSYEGAQFNVSGVLKINESLRNRKAQE